MGGAGWVGGRVGEWVGWGRVGRVGESKALDSSRFGLRASSDSESTWIRFFEVFDVFSVFDVFKVFDVFAVFAVFAVFLCF